MTSPELFVVTGGSGFVGARAVRVLCEEGFRVRALGTTADPKRLSDLRGQVEYLAADLSDEATLERALDGADRVLHFAAAGVAWTGETSFADLVRTNLLDTRRLILASGRASVGKVVLAGSVHEYGRTAALGALSARAPADPLTMYGVSKAAAALMAPLAGDEARVETTTLRIFSPYGPGESPSRFVPSVVLAALKGSVLAMTAGEQLRDFCYVDDVARAFIHEAQRENGKHCAFNLGTGRALALQDAAQIILDAVRPARPSKVEILPYRQNEAWRLIADAEALDPSLRSRLSTRFEEGVKKTVGWFSENLEGKP